MNERIFRSRIVPVTAAVFFGIAVFCLYVGRVKASPAAVNLALSDPTQDSITLSWTAVGEDGNSGMALDYVVKYANFPITDATWPSALNPTANPPTPGAPGTVQSMIVTGLSPSTQYYFAMKAHDHSGGYSISNSPALFTLPVSGNNNLPATPSTLSATLATNGNDVVLTWVDNSTNESEFKVFSRPQNATAWTYLGSVGANIVTYTVAGQPVGAYEYQVAACNMAGCSDDSNTVVFTKTNTGSGGSGGTGTGNPPPTPGIPTPTNYSGKVNTAYSFNTFLSPDPDGNQVKAVFDWGDGSMSDSNTGLVTVASGVVSALGTHSWSSTGIYSIKVKAVDSTGLFSGWTSTATMTVGISPNIPVIGSVTANGSNVTVVWSETSSDVTGFKLYRQLPGVTIQSLPDQQSTAVSYTDTNVPAGTYNYYMQAYNLSGGGTYPVYSNPSSLVSVTVVSTSTTVTDTTPPIISNVTSTNAYPNVPAQIIWATDDPSDSRVYWGAASDSVPNNAGTTRCDGSSNVTAHCVYLNTNYTVSSLTYVYYKVFSKNAAGLESASTVKSFLFKPTSSVPNTTSPILSPTVDLKVDGSDSTVERTVPANYTLTWTTTNNPTVCTPGDTWAASGNKSTPSGSWNFNGVTALGMKTYTLTCSNSVGYSTDTVYVNVVTSTSPVSTPPAATTTTVVSQNGSVRINVSDSNGTSLGNVVVSVFKDDYSDYFKGITDNDGIYRTDLPVGSYSVEIFSPLQRTDLLKPAPFPFLISSGEIKNISLKFAAQTSLVKIMAGKVSFSDGSPVSDAVIGVYSRTNGQFLNAFTDSLGNYSLKVMPGGYLVSVRPKDPSSSRWPFTNLHKEVVFAADNNAETKAADFAVFLANQKVTVKTVDDAGAPVPGIWLVADTVSASMSSSEMRRVPPNQQVSGADSLAIFELSEGTYYLRAILPPNAGYINPDETSFEVKSTGEKNITLILPKKTVANKATITGTVKLDNGNPTGAFVWAWSEEGGSASVNANAAGEFSLPVSFGTKWHVGAGKGLSGIAYKSPEIVVDVNSAVVSVEIILEKGAGKKIPPKVEVVQEASQTIVAKANDGAGITLPPTAAVAGGNISVAVAPTIEAPSQAASKVVSTVYDVTVKDQGGKDITQLQSEAEIVLPYDPTALKDQGVSEDAIIPSYFDEKAGAWVKIDDYTIDKIKHVVVARVKHLTRFAIVAAADTVPPNAPTNVKVANGGAGEIVVSWVNPSKDFSHAKVYRSDAKGKLGSIIANDLTVSQFSDVKGSNKVTYFYTVRAVDPAGNESGNVDQVSGTVVGTSVLAGGFLRNLGQGSQGEDVKLLQRTLAIEEVYPEKIISGTFGPKTRAAVVKFQEKYSDEILSPIGFSKGTGFVGNLTRLKLNKIISQ
jgi:hypothetical protein